MKSLKRAVISCGVAGALVLGVTAEGLAAPNGWTASTVGAGVNLFAVNDAGHYVGTADGPAGSGTNDAVISYGGPLERVRPAGSDFALFNDINSAGVAAGYGATTNGSIGFTYDHGTLRTFGPNTIAEGINDAGVVAVTRGDRPYLIALDGTETALPTGGYSYGRVLDVANNGWATGVVNTAPEIFGFPVVWDPAGTLTILPMPPETRGIGYKVNSSGTVALIAADGNNFLPYVYRNGAVELLPRDGAANGMAIGVTDNGEFAGTLSDGSYPGVNRPVVWTATGIVDVRSSTNPDPGDGVTVNAISNTGHLVGFQLANDVFTGVVLTARPGKSFHPTRPPHPRGK